MWRRNVIARVTHCSKGHEYTEANTKVIYDSAGRWWKSCRQCARDYARARYRKNPDKIKEQVKEWGKKNPDKVRQYKAKWRIAEDHKPMINAAAKRNQSKPKSRERINALNRKQSATLNHNYVKKSLKSRGFKSSEITADLIELQANLVRIKREVWSRTEGSPRAKAIVVESPEPVIRRGLEAESAVPSSAFAQTTKPKDP